MSNSVSGLQSGNSFSLEEKGKAHAHSATSAPLRKVTEETHTKKTIFQKICTVFSYSSGQSTEKPKQATVHKLDVPEKKAPQMEEIETVRKTCLPEKLPPAGSIYIDKHKLLCSSAGNEQVASFYEEWYREEASLLSQFDSKDPATQQKLAFLVLQAYSKAASVGEKTAQNLGIQTTPLNPDPAKYHRSTKTETLDNLRNAYSDDLGIRPHELEIIDSPLIVEVFERQCPTPQINQSKLDLRIDSLEKFQTQLRHIFAEAKPEEIRAMERYLLFDLTSLLQQNPIKPQEMKEKLISQLEEIVIHEVARYFASQPEMALEEKQKLAITLVSKVTLFALSEHKGQSIILCPEFLVRTHDRLAKRDDIDPRVKAVLMNSKIESRHGNWDRQLSSMMINAGYRVSPERALKAWLKVEDIHTILHKLDIPEAHFPWKEASVGENFKSFTEFLTHPTITKFLALSKKAENSPYLKVLPEATGKLLLGLKEYDVQGTYKKQGLSDLLQVSYYRLLVAMAKAIYLKENSIEFFNQIELIHQQIQNILEIVRPYSETDTLVPTVCANLTTGTNPLIPEELTTAVGLPKVHLKASAMHSLSSIMASVEAEKGSRSLNVAVLNDSYYESQHLAIEAKTHTTYAFDGDQFAKKGIAGPVFGQIKTEEETVPIAADKVPPIDLFICEFHHNISVTRTDYKPENVLEQTIALVEKALPNHKMTVAIDSTIDIQDSTEVKAYLQNSKIQQFIREGRLNVVIYRSTQKFDMLGMDNYYGGLSVEINNAAAFSQFNSRMNLAQDELGGLSRQGITHLQKYAATSSDRYREAIMENTRLLYSMIPPQSIYQDGSTNPMQVSRINDPRTVFIDIKFPNHKKTAQEFLKRLNAFAESEKLPYTTRASFGFATTNFTVISGNKFRLNVGLDSQKTLARYAAFFEAFQKAVDEVMSTASHLSNEEQDTLLEQRLKLLTV